MISAFKLFNRAWKNTNPPPPLQKPPKTIHIDMEKNKKTSLNVNIILNTFYRDELRTCPGSEPYL